MNRIWIVALACAVGVTGLAETATHAAAEARAPAPRTLETLRAQAQGEAIANLAVGDVQTVGNRRAQRRRAYAPRRYGLRYLHRRGRWCGRGRYYGRRCYYTPRILRPFRR